MALQYTGDVGDLYLRDFEEISKKYIDVAKWLISEETWEKSIGDCIV